MAALQYAHVPGYRAIMLRRSYADLNLPEALIPLSHQWLQGKASWNGKLNEWTFPSGATLTFGYLENERDKYRYQGAEVQFVDFDELTQFTESQYRYLFSRLCRKEGVNVPLRMRSGSNPGGVGHDWVKKRFLASSDPDREFIGARLEHNPHVDRESYELSLKQLDPITRRQLRYGDWDVHTSGLFRKEWFRYWKPEGEFYRLHSTGGDKLVRIDDCVRFPTVDCAGVEKRKPGHDPDYSVSQVWDLSPDGDLILVDQWRAQVQTTETEDSIVRQVGQYDLPYVGVEYAHVGIGIIQHLRKRGIAVRAIRAKGSKAVRSQTAQIRAEAGTVYFPANQLWVSETLEPELLSFTGTADDARDDQVDCFSYAAIHAQRLAGAIVGQADEARDARRAELQKSEDESEVKEQEKTREMALEAAAIARRGEDESMWVGFGDDD